MRKSLGRQNPNGRVFGSAGEVTDHSLPAPLSNVIKARGGARKTLKPHPNVRGYH